MEELLPLKVYASILIEELSEDNIACLTGACLSWYECIDDL